ncbi:hypothetical protein HY469_00755, partial [Candidatus Roizmanbacteria bacterium]|nr:hypothetical protein [Candidatus Roizmanbacteria bacterium]
MRHQIKPLLVSVFIVLNLLSHQIPSPIFAISPPVQPSLQEKLQTEIQKMIDAGHLRPSYMNANEFYWARVEDITMPRTAGDYWYNPADTIYTLIRALPHMPTSQQTALRNYIQSEWAYAPPTQYTHMGWLGRKRERYDLPEEILPGGNTSQASDVLRAYSGQNWNRGTHDAWDGWDFNPFNYYAAWKYAQTFPEVSASSLLAEFRSNSTRIPEALPVISETQLFPNSDWLLNRPHVLNVY